MTAARPAPRAPFLDAETPDLGDTSIRVARRTMATDARSCARATPVTHTYAALSFHTGGRSQVEQRGRWTLEPGDVLLVPAGEPHRMLDAARADLWGVGFCVPCIAADDVGRLLEPFERVRAGGSAVVRIPPGRHAFLEELFRELEAACAPARRGEPLAVRRSLLTLVLHEVERAARLAPDAPAGPRSVVADSLAYIERHCLGALTLQDVARAVGRSPAYVTTALTRATGRSAGAWIVAGRMAEARRRLLHSDERIDIVAERVGYADPTHFIRMFRRAHGATPAAWRAAQARSR